jgi:DNA-3-methyladenine glycosylase II
MSNPDSARIIRHLSAADPILAEVIRAAGAYALIPETTRTPFESLLRAIVYQQLNGVAAGTILKRLINCCGTQPYPQPEDILRCNDTKLRQAGLSFNKIAALKDLSSKAQADVVPDTATLQRLDDEAIIERLTQVRGVGRWTVEMLLMFQLGRPDVLPCDDFGVRNGFRLAYGLKKMPEPKVLAAYGKRWQPQRSAAAWYCWRAVDLHREGKLPKAGQRVTMPRIRRKRRRL